MSCYVKNIIHLAFYLLISIHAFADNGKYALIIGNDNYQGDFKPLPTCVNDAHEINSCLTALGYKTILVENASREQIMESMNRFESLTSTQAAIGVFFYSGHAVTIHGEPYIIPANTAITTSKGRLKEFCVGVGSIKEMMRHQSKKSILFLDACRNVVYGETKGMSGWVLPSNNANNRSEQIVCFATALDDVARPGSEGLSPFTHVLCSHLFDRESFQKIWTECIEKEVYDISCQRPTWEGTFTDLFYFNPEGINGTDIIPAQSPVSLASNIDKPDIVKPDGFEVDARFKDMTVPDIIKYAKKAIGEDAVIAYKSAVAKGYKDAYAYLGDVYFNGAGVKKSRRTALEYYKMLPENPHCIYMIAKMHLYGWGGEDKDRAKGKEWLQKAIKAGSEEATVLYDKEFGGMN